jgi:large subunit ribosomal protein L24
MKLKLNDTVTVITGKDKGKSGKITKVFPQDNKVIVAGVNKYKKHLKRKDAQNPGGVVELERPLNVSKVMLTIDGKLTRVGYTLTKTNEKIRIAKKTKAPIDKS